MIIVGGRAYTMLSDGTHDYAVGLDAASGEETWRFRMGSTLNLPNADPGRLYNRREVGNPSIQDSSFQ